jgi:hypothetical protein
VRLDQIDERLPWHHCLHLREELLPFGLLFGGGDLVIREAKLLTTHTPVLNSDHRAIVPQTASVFQSLPKLLIFLHLNEQGYFAYAKKYN